MMRVLVCGGRDFSAIDAWNWLERYAKAEIAHALGVYSFGLSALIHGGARGADEGARDWGKSEGIPVHCFEANWRKYGKRAGPMRNQRMIDEGKPDVVIAFPGGNGTADMVRRAEAAGIRVIRTDAPE
jgi:hypothetical protein